jgi:hypothetical protein
MGEFGTVDDDDAVGFGLKPGIHRLIDAPDQLGEPGQNRQRPHDGHIGERENRPQPFRFHRLAADAGKHDGRIGLLLQRRHQLAAEQVAGMLARNDENPARSRFQIRSPLTWMEGMGGLEALRVA